MSEARKLEREEDMEAVLEAELGTGVPVYLIDVVVNRDVSNAVAARVGVPHESPQAILLRRGEPVWQASHGGVRARAMAAAFEAIDSSPPPSAGLSNQRT